MAYITKLQRCLRWLLFTVILGILWITLYRYMPLTQCPSEKGWYRDWSEYTAANRSLNSWLEYTAADWSPGDDCNCSAILQGDTEALQEAKLLTITKDFKMSVQIPDKYYIDATQDCRKFKLSRKYLTFPLSQEEEDFPMAFSIVVHHKVQNFERLLRAIYAPQNVYCIHVDKKAEASDLAAVSGISSCFDNVFMVSQSVSVVYAAWPRVQADINCMADLYTVSTTWKYFINLCGQDFPLKTNLEMVRSLQVLKGQNSLESEPMPDRKKWRFEKVHQIVNGQIQGTGQAKAPPPFNLTIFSGNAYMVVSRGYVRSVLEDNRLKELMEWAGDTHSPDEFLWATIQRMPDVPGSTWTSYKFHMSDFNAIARLVKWAGHEGPRTQLDAVYPACHGTHVRGVCVYGAGDLQWLLEQHHLFANKFDVDTDVIAIRCLEKYLRSKALAEKH